MEGMEGGRRIPISEGFYIYFSSDGRAMFHGRKDFLVLDAVEHWLNANKNDCDYQLVTEWVEQRKRQMADDVERQRIRAKRKEINDSVDRAARGTRLDKDLVEIVRSTELAAKGIPPKED
jgi:hypothetical protein